MRSKTSIAMACIVSLMAVGCGDESSKHTESVVEKPMPDHVDHDHDDLRQEDRGVSIRFTLPADVRRAQQVKGQPKKSGDGVVSVADTAWDCNGGSGTKMACEGSGPHKHSSPGELPVQDSRIRVSCLDELPLDISAVKTKQGDYFEADAALWSAPTLRIGLEELGPDFASYGQSEVPFLCQGDAMIEILDLDSAAAYSISAELLDFDMTPLYAGGTGLFGIAQDATTYVVLAMNRVDGGSTGSVVVDVVFDGAGGGNEPQPAPMPEALPMPADQEGDESDVETVKTAIKKG